MDLSMVSILIPLILGSVLYKSLSFITRLFCWYVVLGLLFELISFILFKIKLNNLWVFHLHTIFEFGIFSFGISYLLLNRTVKTIMLTISGIILIYLIANSVIFFDNNWNMNNSPRVLESVFIVLVSIFYLFQTSNKSNYPFLENMPNFILVAGLLFVFSGRLVIFLFFELQNDITSISSWIAHSLLNILLNIIIAIVFWKTSRQQIIN